MDTAITTELKTEIGLLESRHTDLHTYSDSRFNTQDREFRWVSDELVTLN